jgi:hypothetical protein
VTVDIRRSHWAAALILGLFVVLAVIYSVVAPIFESSDERYHYPVVVNLIRGEGLPVQQAEKPTYWQQEASQPPLYYQLAAALTARVDVSDYPGMLFTNPFAQRGVGVPNAHDNKNMFIHTGAEAYPWQRTTLAVHLMRFFSIVLAAGTVFCTYRLGLMLFPGQPALALAAMAVNAFVPMFLFVSASVNNDNLIIFLASLTLLILVGLIRRGPAGGWVRGVIEMIVLGVLIGLASLSKLTGLGLIPLACLALALARLPRLLENWHTRWRGEALRWAGECLLVVGAAVLVAKDWYLRNLQLYGDPTGLNAMLDVAGRRVAPVGAAQLLGEFQGFRINFWGLFGAVNVFMRPGWIYRVLDAISLLAVIGLIVWLVRSWRSRKLENWREWLVVAAWVAAVFVGLVRWTSLTPASQGRLMFPAIGGLALFLVLGLAWPWPAHIRRWVAWGLPAILLALAVATPFVAIRPTYATPILAAKDIPLTAHAYNATYGGEIRLLAYEVGKSEVRSGQEAPITLYWQALAPMQENYAISLLLLGHEHQFLGNYDSFPGRGNYPTTLWTPGQIVKDTFNVRLVNDAYAPVAATIEVGLYRMSDHVRLPVIDATGAAVGTPIISRIKVAGDSPHDPPTHKTDANLDNRVRLVGYDLPEMQVKAGSELPITLHWQVTNRLAGDYTIFIHLLDAQGQLAGQSDGPPLNDEYPTSFWAPGDSLADAHTLRVKPDAGPGPYRIVAGLYDPATGQRLPVIGGDGKVIGDEIEVATLAAP